ncbi:YkvA family protein [Cryobacterium aureum]|uniref:YkvA family protein n=1 Tax=Cryobacterium aureum TaxID=995037 RepID=UPI000CF3A864|nr:YkvA family protein [Cryobacterium aureum]
MLIVRCRLLAFWLVLVVVLWNQQRRYPTGASFRDLVRLVPDVAWLLKGLSLDKTVSVGVRIWIAVLLVYLISPIDLIPDFIPVRGFADDAIVVALAFRFATRRAGSDAVRRHWPGTSEGLAAVLLLARLNSPS